MKKLSLIFTVIFGAFLCVTAKAQTTTDYFPGTWKVIVWGTPRGDAKMTFVLERKDGKLTGAVQDSTGKEMTKITAIEEKDKTITVVFTVQSLDLTLLMEPVDEDHVKGSLLGMFDAEGVRVKENK
jgi:hypothetical protein